MNSPSRSSFTATLLANGKLLVVGGASGTYPYTVLSSAELYDPASGAWTNTSAMKTPRYGHTATLLSNGKVLVSGGDTDGSSIVTTATAELYDPATGLWTFAGAMSTPRYLSVATALPDGKVLVIGGDNETNGYLSSAELYDPSADSWSGAGTMTTLRQSPMATALLDGKVLVTGGYNGSYLASSGTLQSRRSNMDSHSRWHERGAIRGNGNPLAQWQSARCWRLFRHRSNIVECRAIRSGHRRMDTDRSVKNRAFLAGDGFSAQRAGARYGQNKFRRQHDGNGPRQHRTL